MSASRSSATARSTVEIIDAGHQVAIHGYRHRVQLRMTPSMVADDLDRAADVIANAAGFEPRLHRPPLGIYSPAGLAAVRQRGWQPLLWSRWGRDWRRNATPDTIADNIGTGFQAGEVLLLHDADHYSSEGSHRRTAAALPRIFAAVKASGTGRWRAGGPEARSARAFARGGLPPVAQRRGRRQARVPRRLCLRALVGVDCAGAAALLGNHEGLRPSCPAGGTTADGLPRAPAMVSTARTGPEPT